MDKQYSAYIKYSWFIIVVVFFVILAGGVVRMTQSGMGCPDWPKCFGLWIPPIDASQLPTYYEDFLSKQDIDHSFNAYHTWIEYINRLLGALLGFFIIGYVVWTYRLFWNSKRVLVYLAISLLIAVSFEGYLGKVVVDQNLDVLKITLHMLGALIIAAIPIIIVIKLKNSFINVSNTIKYLSTLAIVLLLIQIILGTQVREDIDIISKALEYNSRELWIGRLGNSFIIHRTFSWVILLISLYTYYKGKDIKVYNSYIRGTLYLLFVIILLGIVMAYLNMPAIAQPFHLLFACILLMQIFYTRLIMN